MIQQAKLPFARVLLLILEAVGLFEEVLKSVDEKTRNEIMRGR